MSNLKKCPFCGGEAKICGYYFIQCTKCGVSTLTYTDRESAINTWNTRIHTVEAKPVVWKSIAGFEGLYEVSNFGSVRNGKGEIKKQGIKRTTWTCYKTVKLWKDGKYHTKYIHRLIAEAFIPNPDNLPFINHKDEDGTNNSIENLEWCTREYNANYGTAQKKRIKKLKNVPHTEEHKQKISEGLKKHYSENEVWNKGVKMGKRADMRGGKNE